MGEAGRHLSDLASCKRPVREDGHRFRRIMASRMIAQLPSLFRPPAVGTAIVGDRADMTLCFDIVMFGVGDATETLTTFLPASAPVVLTGIGAVFQPPTVPLPSCPTSLSPQQKTPAVGRDGTRHIATSGHLHNALALEEAVLVTPKARAFQVL